MCPTNLSSGNRIVVHKWHGRPLGVRLFGDNASLSFQITPLDEDEVELSAINSLDAHRIRYAAEIVLNLDTATARLVQHGQSARLLVKRSRRTPPCTLVSADQAYLKRPRVEELIAPLLFNSDVRYRLRPFQEYGVQWLIEHKSAILADDMGLGKTAQSLRALEQLVRSGAIRCAVVICPKSLLANWEAECSRWVPDLTVVRVVPTKDESNAVWSAIVDRSHIIVTSYEQLRPLPQFLADAKLGLVVADEAHRLRRSQAKVVKSFRLLRSERIWALTGTPIERHELDLATLLSILEPTRFSIHSASIGFQELRGQARPFLLRRLKQDMLSELPDVIDTKELVELTNEQARAYNLARSKPLSKDIGEILQRFNLMRSICDLEPKSESSCKLDRIVEILQAVKGLKEKAVVFSYLLRPLEVLAKRLSTTHTGIGAVTLTGKLTGDERARALQEFKSQSGIVALLCSSRVGGEGLTLTEANHVIFVNEWWNPSANDQARDRVVRFGQERIVHVHRFRCKGTIEESLEQILKRKSETFTAVVDALVTKSQHIDRQSRMLVATELRKALLETSSAT